MANQPASTNANPSDTLATHRPPAVRRVVILGSTGSVGRQTLDVIDHLNALHERGEWATRYEVLALAAGRNADALAEQVRRYRPAHAALAEGELGVGDVPCRAWLAREPHADPASSMVAALGLEAGTDMVVAAMVGFAGLGATLAAVEHGVDVALANKETLVAAGSLVTAAARASGARLLPVDSEHAGVWQCLMRVGAPPPPIERCPPEIARVTLTASGGAFRDWTKAQIARATPQDALNHPTWDMGAKVTIDSASLMNKALELIEAHWLFGLEADRLAALVHRQSIVHALAETTDGSVIAQLASADMRGPILHALAWPAIAPARAPRLTLDQLRELTFEEPDPERFPSLGLGFEVIRREGAAGAVLNAANEVGVEAFLAGRLAFPKIHELARGALDALGEAAVVSIEDVHAADRAARAWARARLDR